MSIQVLISAMNEEDFGIAARCNIQTDAVIINQCDVDSREKLMETFGTITMVNTRERGLSKSRNMALKNATGDICVICDDDVRYIDGYGEIIKHAFEEVKDADILVFNIKPVNAREGEEETTFRSIKRIPRYKSYGSVHIAFRRNSILRSGILFNENFGAGSGCYSMSEDTIFFAAAHKARLKCYTYPRCIAEVDFSASSWFRGYDAEYFYDIGAFLTEAYPREKALLKWYYPLRMRGITELPASEIMKMINAGMKGYANKKSFREYFAAND